MVISDTPRTISTLRGSAAYNRWYGRNTVTYNYTGQFIPMFLIDSTVASNPVAGGGVTFREQNL